MKKILFSSIFIAIIRYVLSQECQIEPTYNIIPPDYDKTKPPFLPNGPLHILLSVWITSVTSINELQQDFTVDLYLRLGWKDHRINYPECETKEFILIDTSILNQIWMPDLFFRMEKRASRHDILRRNAALRMHKDDNKIWISERLTVTIVCGFDFKLFPMDRQICTMMMETYMYYKAYVNLTFDEPGIYMNNFKFRIPQYKLTSVTPGNCSYSYAYQGQPLDQTCVQATFIFDRMFNYYFIQMYIPSTMIVCISFLSFWIPVDVVPGRIALAITTLLTLSTQFTAMQTSLPPVSYMKAIDSWMFFCIFMVFGTLIEFTVSYNYFLGHRTDSQCYNKVHPDSGTSNNHQLPPAPSKKSKWRKCSQIFQISDRRYLVDHLSKFIFPLLFVIFNMIYWTYYLVKRSDIIKDEMNDV